jgi:hypothetical protein
MGKKNVKKFNAKKRPQGRAGHLMTSSGSIFYVGGGYSENGPLSDFWQFEKEWKCLSPSSPTQESPFPRMMCDGCQFGDEIFLFGGIQQFDDEVLIQNDLWKFDARSKRWVLLQSESPISERYNHVVTAISPTQMLVHGGECSGLLGDCWVYNIPSKSFTQVPTPEGRSPCPRSSHSCAFLHPYVVLFGGVTNSSVCGEEQGESEGSMPIYLNDLWLLDVSVSADPAQWSWRMLPFEGLAPSPRDMTSLVDVSELTERPYSMLLFGGYGLAEVDEDGKDEEDGEINGNEDCTEIDRPEDFPVPVTSESEVRSSAQEESITPLVQSLTLSDESLPHPPPSVPSGDLKVGSIDVAEERDEAQGDADGSQDEEGSICESYLNDAWLVDILTGQAREVELMSRKDSKQPFFGLGWRGSRFAVLRSSDSGSVSLDLCCFGGFNGQQFAEHVPSISIQ